MLAPYPVRLRSSSNPPRPRPLTVDTNGAQSPSNPVHPDPSKPPSTPHSPVESAPNSPKIKVRTLAGISLPSSRKIFRLKRPASSSSSLLPIQSPTASIIWETQNPTPNASAIWESHITSPPPRPTRNPARPSSSSGHPPHPEKLHYIPNHPITPPVHYVEIPLDGAEAAPFPMPTSADVALQRKRSRRKPHRSETTDTVKPEALEADLQFSTADRTILEELKLKMQARDSQFQIRAGKRHHTQPASEVPYPTNYERHVLDNDIWETRWAQQVCGSVTWHVFDDPPARVLDIGCGVGTWICDCARVWKNTHFVGLDIVPVQPDLQQVGSSQLASRITWVQANFLEGLPFQDEEFDYVHIKRIARGVPEDKWDTLLEEISRVMKPGGAIEIIEEDLYLPGRLRHPTYQGHPRTFSPTPPSFDRPRAPTPASSSRPLTLNPGHLPAALSRRPGMGQRRSTEPLPPLLPRLPTDDTESVLDAVSEEGTQATQATPGVLPAQSTQVPGLVPTKPRPPGKESKTPVNPRDHGILDFIYCEMHSQRFVNMQPLSLLANSLGIYFKDVRTHPPVIASFPPRLSVSQTPSLNSSATPSLESDTDSDVDFRPSLFHVNGTPPLGSKRRTTNSPLEISTTLDRRLEMSGPFVTLDDSRYSAFSPSPRAAFPTSLSRQPSLTRRNGSNRVGTETEEPPPLPHHSHFQQSQHSLHSPSLSSPSHSQSQSQSQHPVDMRVPRLPNKKMDFDVGSLNLHLTLKVNEVLACSEAMWDYVLDYQKKHKPPPPQPHYYHPPVPYATTLDHYSKRAPQQKPQAPRVDEPFHTALMEMTRMKFNTMLDWFEFDMRDNIGLTPAVHTHLGWGIPISTNAHEKSSRHEFDKACRRWAYYQSDPIGYFAALEAHESDGGSSEDDAFGMGLPRTNVSNGLGLGKLMRSRMSATSLGSGAGWEPDLPPTERLSRTLRVLVAWKAKS